MTEGSCTCPAAISTATNRSKLSAIWASPEWAEFIRVHTAGKKCENCKKREGDIATNAEGEEYIVHLTVDHPFRWAYKSKELYLDFEASMCRVVCRTCNSSFEHGLDICPECFEHYKPMREPICKFCLFKKYPKTERYYQEGQVDQKKRQHGRNQKRYRKLHPHSCDRRGQGQRCKYRPGMVCDQNTRNAPKNKCGHFKARKGAKA